MTFSYSRSRANSSPASVHSSTTQRRRRSGARDFVARFRRLRELLDLSQGEVADLASEMGPTMHQQTIAKIEGGKRLLRLDGADVLACVVGSTMEDLLRPELTMSAAQLRRQRKAVAGEIERLEAEHVAAESVALEAEQRLRQVKADPMAQRRTADTIDRVLNEGS